MLKINLNLYILDLIIYKLIPFKKNCYITCTGKIDGIGAQTQAIYSTLLYCSVNKIPYCHTFLNKIDHNYNNDFLFSQKAEHFFCFSKGEKIADELRNEWDFINLDTITIRTIFLVLRYLFTPKPYIVFEKSHFHDYVNGILPKYITIKKLLRDKFYTNAKTNGQNANNKLNIAMHIRRGDVIKTDTGRYTSNSLIYDRLSKFISILNYNNIKFNFHIYSEGNKDDFTELLQIGSLNLNGDVFSDFYNLVKADVLFMAKSSFSYSAALLSEGIIIYEPFFCPPLDDWFVLDEDIYSARLSNAIQSTYFERISRLG